MENKKKFVTPEAIIVSFNSEDIIVTSGQLGQWWGEEPGDQYQD